MADRNWAGMAVLLVVLGTVTSSVHAGQRRVAAIGAVCPADAPDKEIDASGVDDECVAREPVRCAAKRRLVQDASHESDRCFASGAATKGAGQEPSCGDGLDLKTKAGADSCERRAKPVCAAGFHLIPKAKEDPCVP